MAKNGKCKPLLPKRIAGVKVPKSVRKGRLGELLASQTGQELLAEAVQENGPARRRARKDAGASGEALAIALSEAARAFVKALIEHQKSLEPTGPDWRDAGQAGTSKRKRAPSAQAPVDA